MTEEQRKAPDLTEEEPLRAEETVPEEAVSEEPMEENWPEVAPQPEAKHRREIRPGAPLRTAVSFWLLVLYDLPVIGLIASALAGFWLAGTKSHRALARACFFRGLLVTLILGGLTAAFFLLRGDYSLSNFLERLLSRGLEFVRANGERL